MEKNFLKRDLDDIVFESRNRAYGAYQLRKGYGRNIKKASLLGFAFSGLLLVSPMLLDVLTAKRIGLEQTAVIMDEIKIEEQPKRPELPPPPPPPPPPKTPPTIRFMPPIVSEEQETEPPLPKIDDITAAVSTVTAAGDTSVHYVAPVEPPSPPPPPATKQDDKEVVPQVLDLFAVEQKPEFADGERAMYKFLSENIKYPAIERENGIEGIAYVSFVVWIDGSIRNVAVKRSPSGGLGNEAARVVAMMPNWKAGKQNGRAVPVSFTLPIKFKLD